MSEETLENLFGYVMNYLNDNKSKEKDKIDVNFILNKLEWLYINNDFDSRNYSIDKNEKDGSVIYRLCYSDEFTAFSVTAKFNSSIELEILVNN